MRKMVLLFSLLFLTAAIIGCSKTITQSTREESARPRVEQRALSKAMDIAFSKVDFNLVSGKRVFVETQGLSKVDVLFITALLNSKIVQSGGVPVDKEIDADIKALNIVKVSGTDEIKRRIVSDKVRGQFKGTFTFIDAKNKKVVRIYELDAEADEAR